MNGRIPNPGVRPLHQGQPVAHAGAVVSRAKAAMILLHGRGASAEDILSLAQAFAQPDIAYFSPQAAGHSWYPHSFLAPLEDNEPWLSSALQVIADMLRDLASDGIPPSRVVLLGFSQGGCLTLEFAARNARRYGAVIGLSAGLIGPGGTSRAYSGALQGTPVFLGCSDVDPHIPLARVHESSRSLSNLGGTVEERIYPGMGHTINEDEIKHVHSLLTQQVSARLAGAEQIDPPIRQFKR
jgi:phospholipase/carboxylesterase